MGVIKRYTVRYSLLRGKDEDFYRILGQALSSDKRKELAVYKKKTAIKTKSSIYR